MMENDEQKLKINGIFQSKGYNSAENYSTGPKFKLNLHILVTHLIIINKLFRISIQNVNL